MLLTVNDVVFCSDFSLVHGNEKEKQASREVMRRDAQGRAVGIRHMEQE